MINERLLKGGALGSLTTTARTAADQIPAATTSSKVVPCLGYCEQVISRCVGRANLESLNERWRAYVVALAELAKKLTSQYNIITIIGPIDVQISEAIMNFQENAKNITDQVFQACGDVKQPPMLAPGAGPVASSMPAAMAALSPQSRPVLNRLGKRAAPAVPSHLDTMRRQHQHQPSSTSQQRRQQRQQMQHLQASTHRGQPSGPSPGSDHGGEHGGIFDPLMLGGAVDEIDTANLPLMQLHKKSPLIIGDIRDYILSTKNFWSQLPGSVCTSAISANLTGGSGGGSSAYNSQNNNYLRRNVANTQNCFQEPLGGAGPSLGGSSTTDFTIQNTQDLRFRNETLRQVTRLELVHSRITDASRGVEIDWITPIPPTVGDYPNGVVTVPTHPAVRPPPFMAVQPGEGGAVTSGSLDDEEEDDSDTPEDELREGSGEDIEDPDHDQTTTDHTEPDECVEDDDPLCPPGETTTSQQGGASASQPDDGGQTETTSSGGDPSGGVPHDPAVPPSIPVDGDNVDDLMNGKPHINDDLIGNNELMTVADPSARRSAAYGSALHQLFVIQSQFSFIVQLLPHCILVLALSVVTHNNHHHHLRLMHHH